MPYKASVYSVLTVERDNVDPEEMQEYIERLESFQEGGKLTGEDRPKPSCQCYDGHGNCTCRYGERIRGCECSCHGRLGDAEVFLVTVGCNYAPFANYAKGHALQKIVQLARNTVQDDVPIAKILKEVSGKVSEHYSVSRIFRIKDLSGKIQEYTSLHEFIHIDEFPDVCISESRHSEKDDTWRQCNNCEKWMHKDRQRGRKCRSCSKGNFVIVSKNKRTWSLEYEGKKADVICVLVERGFLTAFKDQKKRIDSFKYADGVFHIFEAKNREKTMLRFSDVRHTLLYPLVMKRCGYKVKELRMIYNGGYSAELKQQLAEGYAKKFDFALNFSPIKEYLGDRKIFLERILVERVRAGERKLKYIPVYAKDNKLPETVYVDINVPEYMQKHILLEEEQKKPTIKTYERINEVWKLMEERGAVETLPHMTGRKEYFYESAKGVMRLISVFDYEGKSIDYWEINCVKGDLLDDVEKYNDRDDAEERILSILE